MFAFLQPDGARIQMVFKQFWQYVENFKFKFINASEKAVK